MSVFVLMFRSFVFWSDHALHKKSDDESPLYKAAESGHLWVVERLIAAQADVFHESHDRKYSNNNTILILILILTCFVILTSPDAHNPYLTLILTSSSPSSISSPPHPHLNPHHLILTYIVAPTPLQCNATQVRLI